MAVTNFTGFAVNFYFPSYEQPAAGVPLAGVGETICKFPSDPTVVLGSLSVVAPFICTGLGFVSVFYPYKS
ncbi:hypothetical protein C5167_030820 [Papaver somniferum]|nr:hypothetical protein C5167_030819 [Papaver somniferum]RZC89130.1 hypothetical protein C5167_030820 [Papaver somniferum]